MHRKEVTHSDGSYGKKLRRQDWLTIWDKVKSHGTVIDWCTGREWPVNCMTVISAWWQSNMPFQGQRKWHIPMASYGEILSGWLNYYITRWRHEVSYFGDQFGDQTRWWQDAVEKARNQRSGSQGPGWATLANEKDTMLMAIRVEVNILQFCSVSNSLSHVTF